MIERSYAVWGTSPDELEAAVSSLGPTHDGKRFTAYTEWVVTWRVIVDPSRPQTVEVELSGVMTLPRWRPLRSVPPELVTRWSRLVDALREHELGHVAIAEQAAAEVRAAIAAVPRGPDADATRRAVAGAAEEVIRRAREAERRYDLETRDGATQGASLGALRDPIRIG